MDEEEGDEEDFEGEEDVSVICMHEQNHQSVPKPTSPMPQTAIMMVLFVYCMSAGII